MHTDTFGDEQPQYDGGGGGYDLYVPEMPLPGAAIDGDPAAGDARAVELGVPSPARGGVAEAMDLPTARPAATPAPAAAAATRKRRLAIVDDAPALAKQVYKRWISDASDLVQAAVRWPAHARWVWAHGHR
jgi:hypothetical protein